MFTSITGWQDHIRSGHQYLATAGKAVDRPGVFTNELIFQMAVMAIEGFIVGLSQYHRHMPGDHTLSGLVAGLGAVCPIDPALADRIQQVEAIDDICAMTPARRRPPSNADVRNVLGTGNAVARWVAERVAMPSDTGAGKPGKISEGRA